MACSSTAMRGQVDSMRLRIGQFRLREAVVHAPAQALAAR
jgi:hypothetical protein